jgi:hypothetical protein
MWSPHEETAWYHVTTESQLPLHRPSGAEESQTEGYSLLGGPEVISNLLTMSVSQVPLSINDRGESLPKPCWSVMTEFNF